MGNTKTKPPNQLATNNHLIEEERESLYEDSHEDEQHQNNSKVATLKQASIINSNSQKKYQRFVFQRYFWHIVLFLLLILAGEYYFHHYFQKIMANNNLYYAERLEKIIELSQSLNKTQILPFFLHNSLDYQEDIANISVMFQTSLEEVSQKQAKIKQIEHQSIEIQNTLTNIQQKQAQIERLLAHKEEVQSEDQKFIFPKKIWRYKEFGTGQESYLNTLYTKNNDEYAQLDQYSIEEVTEYNYLKFIPPYRGIQLTRLLDILEQRIATKTIEDLKYTYATFRKRFIMLLILEQHGGIAMAQKFVFVEGLAWLVDVVRDEWRNKLSNNKIMPRVFGFYNISRSSARVKHNRTTQHEVEQFSRKYPGIMGQFLVAVKHNEFITQIIDQILYLMEFPDKITERFNLWKDSQNSDLKYFGFYRNPYMQYFQMASIIAFLKKEHAIRSQNIRSKDEQIFGIEEYGLISLNANLGPERIIAFFENNQDSKIFQNLANYDLKELEGEFGPMKYIHKLPLYDSMNYRLLEAVRGNQHITKGSYLHTFFYPKDNHTFLIDNKQKGVTNQTGKPWHTLPRKIWAYWDNGLQNSAIINQLCIDNIRRYGQKSGFKVTVVTNKTLQEHLPKAVIDRIFHAIKHQASPMPSTYIKYDLIRLALIIEHGGIYMDSSYIAIEDFEWIVNIARQPSQNIFNRYGEVPKAFFFFNPHYGNPFRWTVNTKANTKASWHLGYQNSFIAAQRGSELIRDWYEQLISAIQRPYDKIEENFKRCDVHYDRWSTFNDLYLLPMDMIKYVLGCKQRQLNETKDSKYSDAADYYKMWSMNGYLGQQKFTRHTSYEGGGHDNPYLRQYSQQQAQKMLGKVLHIVKLFNYPVRYLESSLTIHVFNNSMLTDFHKDSIFMKYLYNATRHKIERVPFRQNEYKNKLTIIE